MADRFENHFGVVSQQYAANRPTYPGSLYEWLASEAPDRALAWDCGAGSGQASVALAAHFERVVATDASAEQLARAPAHPRVSYRAAPAEASGLGDHTVSLVTVAQALHWFPLQAFYAEVRRVLKPGGVVAAWTYAAFELALPEADAIVHAYHYGTVEAYWPAARAHVESWYRDLPFPFARLDVPAFHMQTRWTLPQVTGYLRSWSATARHAAAHGGDPVDHVERQLREVWPDPTSPVDIDWPLTVIAARV
jgi:SAM-dependent methyltransferase